ncbi:MAG: hypothetical protein GXO90_02785 [FCB group bacterium]|nr:hypothetical protein [FCB group bacterium]
MDLTNKVELEEYFAEHFDTVLFPVLADLYLQEEDYSRALKVCEIGLGYHPTHLDGLYTHARVLVAMDRLEDAEKSLLALKEEGLYHAKGMDLLVDVQRRLRRAPAVRIKAWEIISRYNPRHPRAASNIRRLKKKIAEGPRTTTTKRKKSPTSKPIQKTDTALKDISQVTAIREETGLPEQESRETPPSFQSTKAADEIDIPEDIFNQSPEPAPETPDDIAEIPDVASPDPEPEEKPAPKVELSFVEDTDSRDEEPTTEDVHESLDGELPVTEPSDSEDQEADSSEDELIYNELDFSTESAVEPATEEPAFSEDELKFADDSTPDTVPDEEQVDTDPGKAEESTEEVPEELTFVDAPESVVEKQHTVIPEKDEPELPTEGPDLENEAEEPEDPVTKFLSQGFDAEPDHEPVSPASEDTAPENQEDELSIADEPEIATGKSEEPNSFTEVTEEESAPGSTEFEIKPLPEASQPEDKKPDAPDTEEEKSDRPLLDPNRAPHVLLEKPENFQLSTDKPLKLNPRMATFTMVAVLYKQSLYHQALQVLDVLEKKGEDSYRIMMERKRIQDALEQDSGD